MLNEQIIISGNIAITVPQTNQNKIVGNMSGSINSSTGTVNMNINIQNKDDAQTYIQQVQQQVKEFLDTFKSKATPIIDLFGNETTTTTTEAPSATTSTTVPETTTTTTSETTTSTTQEV